MDTRFSFYAEIVFVTVLSLVAANLWSDWIKTTLAEYTRRSPHTLFFVAALFTIAAVFFLHYTFYSENRVKKYRI